MVPTRYEAPWPTIKDDVRLVVAQIAKGITEWRTREGIEKSVSEEQQLRQRAEEIVDRAIQQPQKYGIHHDDSVRLSTDPGFRERAVRGAMAEASYLYPLSQLLYLRQGIEDIQCFDVATWQMNVGGKRVMIRPETIPEQLRNDEQLIAFFVDEVLGTPGVDGDVSFTRSHPTAEATYGSVMRLALVRRPAVSGDSNLLFNIRLRSVTDVTTLDRYVENQIFPRGVARFIEACMRAKLNIVVAGSTGSGKTTLLRVLCGMIPDHEVVVTIEDSAELRLREDRGDAVDPDTNEPVFYPWHDHTHQLVTVRMPAGDEQGGKHLINLADLVRLAMRMRPDVIILGECRGEEMDPISQAMTTGHDGSMLTIHAQSAADAINRMRDCLMMSATYGDESRALRMVHRAVDIIIHLRHGGQGRRRLSGIVALGDTENQVTAVYEADRDGPLKRMEPMIGNLPPKVRDRLALHLAGQEIPQA